LKQPRRAGIRKPPRKERAGSRAPETARRYEDFDVAISVAAAFCKAAGVTKAKRRSLAEAWDGPQRGAATGAEPDWRSNRRGVGLACLFSGGRGLHHGDQDAHRGQIIRSGAAGQKTVMADAMEAFRQDMDQPAQNNIGTAPQAK
jgi:hypothetical protein